MDNGQNRQFDGDYFTPGVGEIPVSKNQEDIPNLNIDQSVWSPARDTREIGGNVMEAASADQAPGQNPEMGKIIPLEPVVQQKTLEGDAPVKVNADAVRPEGDHIAKSALQEIKRSDAELSQTGNVSNYCEKIQNMREIYRGNFGKRAV
ncbi:hypothetical protein J6X73_00025 [Candidatus Saccharibacteria bacterium]|nr:hypothetical protein [Candidatus Saccharibacteria bacterium]